MKKYSPTFKFFSQKSGNLNQTGVDKRSIICYHKYEKYDLYNFERM